MKKEIPFLVGLTILTSAFSQDLNFTLTNSSFIHAQTVQGAIVKGDIDGDGDIDIVIQGNRPWPIEAALYLNDGNGEFVKQITGSFIGLDLGDLKFGDVDGDGDLDLFQIGRLGTDPSTNLYINNGNGNFALKSSLTISPFSEGEFDFGDIDNDGDLDLIIGGYTANPTSLGIVEIYKNDGAGNFSIDTNSNFEGLILASLALFDCDNDEDLDMVLCGKKENNEIYTKLYTNNGQGIFTNSLSNTFEGVYFGDLEVGDTDNDGDIDLIINGSNDQNYITLLYENDGSGLFSLSNNANFEGTASGDVKLADFDNDSDLDLIVTGFSNERIGITQIYENIGLNIFTLAANLNGILYSRSVVDDFNGDGKKDIITMGNPNTYYYLNSGSITSLNDLSKNLKFNIFPNPVENLLNININGISLTRLLICDLSGKQLETIQLEEGLQQISINVKVYKQGIYIIELYNKEGFVSTLEFIKN